MGLFSRGARVCFLGSSTGVLAVPVLWRAPSLRVDAVRLELKRARAVRVRLEPSPVFDNH